VDLDRRIPEPELMVDPDQAHAYATADFAEAHQTIVDRFVERFPDLADRADLDVLDLGCGPADVTVRVALALPAATVTGVDGSAAMLAPGLTRVREVGLAERVHLEEIRLPDTGLQQRRFDALVSNSLLHHLPDPAVLWRTVVACARPRAAVFVADLMRPPDRATVDDFVARYTEGEPDVLVDDFRNSLCAAYRLDEVRDQVAAAGLELTIEAVSDRHLIAWGHAAARHD
jgi:ubiquinone/menaquinone biosynthesis C-methylase UbiE